MTAISFTSIKESQKSAHSKVYINKIAAGEVWREEVNVPNPNKSSQKSLKQRWFARRIGDSNTLGGGTRSTLIIGAGFASKSTAANALYLGYEDKFAI